MYTNTVFGTAKCVLFMEVSSLQGVLIRELEVPLYTWISVYLMISRRLWFTTHAHMGMHTQRDHGTKH